MIERIEELELEKKVRIYRKCIDIILSKQYVRGNSVGIEGIMFSFKDLLDVCYCVVPIYGSNEEQMKFFSLYGNFNYVMDDELLSDIALDRMRYVYSYREKNYLNRDKLKKLAKRLNIRIDDISLIAREYAVSYLKYNIKDYNWHIFCKKRDDVKAKMSYNMLFDLLLSFNDKKDIVYIIDYSNVDIHNYRETKITSYVDLYHGDKSLSEKKEIYYDIKKKFDLYMEVREKRKNLDKYISNMNTLNKAREFLRDYVNASKSYKHMSDYCRDIGVKSCLLGDNLAIIKNSNFNSDKKLYDLCLKKINNDKLVGTTDINYIANIISEYILHGIHTKNGVRDFDLIDYYSLTNYSIKEVVSACESMLKKEDYVKVRKFFNVCERLKKTLMNSKKAVDLDIEFDCKKDDDGFPIAGTGRKLSEEERNEILELFNEYDIPLYLFKIAVDRIKNGINVNDLVINREEIKKKIKIHD